MEAVNQSFHMMGTTITLTIFHSNADLLIKQAKQMLEDFERRFSANDPDSDLMKINQYAGVSSVKVDQDLFDLIQKGREIGISSNKRLNIAIGALVKKWRIGFDDAQVPSREEILQTLPLIDPEEILLNPQKKTVFLPKTGMEIDLGAIAKGYFADRLKAFFQSQGVTSGIIDLGGNVLTIGDSPKSADGHWAIGIQNPVESRGGLSAVLKSRNQSVVTSGIYERSLTIGNQTYHHIFDSTTGYPVNNQIASLTIVSDQSIDGEIWTTVLFSQSPEKALIWLNQSPQLNGIIITKKGEIMISNQIQHQVHRLEN
ncbi:FAD:protein FMN transferase [Enterococcus florum]|uniref:FAD:protein FMN transferase n=1 Tax=Enterococcus florum TaxID=2480627 RepID=A0A4P5PAX2_9ENTE|nr:FAD:protein FMN transferase [Enterococcus florum]GCF95257.1 FAD:protein FMN transferase [Enterococcus florum]